MTSVVEGAAKADPHPIDAARTNCVAHAHATAFFDILALRKKMPAGDPQGTLNGNAAPLLFTV
jgi:hypothetical protein